MDAISTTTDPTTSPHAVRLNEFREANADLRKCFAAESETREAQILANLAHAEASRRLMAAQERVHAADDALNNPPAVAVATLTLAPARTGDEIASLAASLTNGHIRADPADMGIG